MSTTDNKNCAYVQNYKQRNEVITTYCENIDEARALANFLWNEGERHRRDIEAINEDLDSLWTKWHVAPSYIKAFVKP